MNNRTHITALLVAAIVAITSIGCSQTGEFQAFPCKIKGNDKWSLTEPSGKIIADDAFDHRPTAITCNRFWAQNEQGYWELYAANDPSRPVIDKEYRYVSYFHHGRAIVAERGKPVTVINVDGEEKVSLDTVDNKRPNMFIVNADGLATVCSDTVQGLINFAGDVVIPTKYHYIGEPSDNRVIAFDHNYAAFSSVADSLYGKSTAKVFDYEGNLVFTISSTDYDAIDQHFTGGYLPVAKVDAKDKEKLKWGLMGPDGAMVVAPSATMRSISEVRGKNFIYSDDNENMGVRSLEGEILIKPRYGYITFIDDTHVAAVDMAEDEYVDNEKASWQLLNIDGTPVASRKFLSIDRAGAGRVFVKTKPERWSIMTTDGEMLADLPVYSEIAASTRQPNYYVQSDYIDINALIAGCDITANSMDGITFQSSVREALERQARYFSSTNKPVASNYSFTNEVNIFPTIEGEMVAATVTFPSNLSHQTYRNERVIDFVWGNYYWYHDNKIPTGYVFTTDRPSKFNVTFNNYGKLRGKLRPLYNNLVKHFSAYGTVIDNNSGATLIDIGNGRKAVVALEGSSVKVTWGRLSADDESIAAYNGNKEDLGNLFAEDEEEEGD